MALTVANIQADAVDRSSLNDANLVSDTLAMRHLDRFQRAVFLRAARENPEYFGVTGITSTRTVYTDGWDVSTTPGRIAAISKLTVNAITGTLGTAPIIAVDDEIHMVHYLYQSLGLTPRVYVRNRVITPVGTELSDATSTNMVTILNVDYTPIPTAFSATTDVISVPDEWADLLVLPLARVMAVKDGQRTEEVAALREEYGEVMEQFIAAVKIFDIGADKPLTAVAVAPTGGGGGQ